VPRTRLHIEPEKNGYYPYARNKNLAASFGFYIAHMDADNEWKASHLSGLLAAIREPDGALGWPHFVYSRREYTRDAGAPEDLPVGKSPLVPWTAESRKRLAAGPSGNFIDTGDFLIGKSTLYELAERTGCVWNTDLRRFADWDLANRLSAAGFRGRAVDQVTHVYHWHEGNLQHQRPLHGEDTVLMPETLYERFKQWGLILEDQRTPHDN
jgi:hypothetical protein